MLPELVGIDLNNFWRIVLLDEETRTTIAINSPRRAKVGDYLGFYRVVCCF